MVFVEEKRNCLRRVLSLLQGWYRCAHSLIQKVSTNLDEDYEAVALVVRVDDFRALEYGFIAHTRADLLQQDGSERE